MNDWMPDLSARDKPHYLAIADAIAEDIRIGRLAPADRLPPQRKLARRLDLDFTTVARGYVEAQKRGLVESRVGQGTFVRASARRRHGPMALHPEIVDLSMNLPPEPDDPELLDRMQDGLEAVGHDLVYLMRYQGFGGVAADKEAALKWLGGRALLPPEDRLFIAPGAHSALLGIFSLLAKPSDVILSEALTYPGARSIAAQLGLQLIGLPMDDEGVDPDAFTQACERFNPKAIYLNPTLLNPTTHTISQTRRIALVAIARRFGVPIVEDDPYGFLLIDGPQPFGLLAPELTWHIAGSGEMPRRRAADSLRDRAGRARRLVVRIGGAHRDRHGLAADDCALDPVDPRRHRRSAARGGASGIDRAPADSRAPSCLKAPTAPIRSAFTSGCRYRRLGRARPSWVTCGRPASAWWRAMPLPPTRRPEAARVCLGGPANRAAVQGALEFMAHALTEQPALASTFL